MRKVSILLVALLVISTIPVMASVDGGFHQKAYFNSGKLKTVTALQLDANGFIVEAPMSFESISVGAQVPINILGNDLYTKPMLKLENFKPSGFSLGTGKEFVLGGYTFKLEGEVENPDWTDLTKWQISPSITINFSLSELFGGNGP